MRRIRSVHLGLLAAALLAVLARPASAQKNANEAQPVTIVTADLVELKGHFYPSAKGAGAPAVMLLHALNEDSKKGGWIALAKALQKEGYAVLRFDFRGCGDSTTVKPGAPAAKPGMPPKRGFWTERDNQTYYKGLVQKLPTSIDLKQFNPGYYPILINDIAAAKAWLDTAPCNSNNLTLIGAKDGAVLGAIWLYSEWSRYRVVPDPRLMKEVPDLENPEGQAVTAAIWLSMTPTLGSRSVSLATLLHKAAAENKTAMLFFAAKGDTAGRKTALALEKVFKNGKGKKSNVAPSTGVGDPGLDGKIVGSALLTGGVPAALAGWLKGTEKDKNVRKSEAEARDPYVWLVPVGARLVPRQARVRGQLMFFNYLPFVR
jgi:hypothetical protein